MSISSAIQRRTKALQEAKAADTVRKELITEIPASAVINYRAEPDSPAVIHKWGDMDQAFRDQFLGASHSTCVDDGAFDSIDLPGSGKTIHTITLREDGETLEVVWAE